MNAQPQGRAAETARFPKQECPRSRPMNSRFPSQQDRSPLRRLLIRPYSVAPGEEKNNCRSFDFAALRSG
jgi:hypothetical protein